MEQVGSGYWGSEMAGSRCDISNILNNSITALYSPVQTHTASIGGLTNDASDQLLTFTMQGPSSELTAGCNWTDDLPHMWTQQHVLDWIDYNVERNKWDASTIDFSQCEMDGRRLCQLSREDMRTIFGGLGDKLYDHLWHLKDSQTTPSANSCDSSDYELKLHFLDECQWDLIYDCIGNTDHLPLDVKRETDSEMCSEKTRDPGYYSICPAGSESCEPRSYSPQAGDSAGSDLEAKASLGRDSVTNYNNGALNKRRRGRPRKLNSHGANILETKKSKHSVRGTHLWEFIRDILLHPDLNEGLLKWEDQAKGVFKFLRSEAVAQLWGQKKKNSSMTYEKLSRAMRYYYKREILERVDGRRLVYKFGKNASGWRLEEKVSFGS